MKKLLLSASIALTACTQAPPPVDCAAVTCGVDEVCSAEVGCEPGVVLFLQGASTVGACQPEVAADPWSITVDAVLENTSAQAATVALDTAELRFTNGDRIGFTVSPASVSLAPGESTTVTLTKDASQDDLPNDCDLCGVGASLLTDFQITLDNGGSSLLFLAVPANLSCIF